MFALNGENSIVTIELIISMAASSVGVMYSHGPNTGRRRADTKKNIYKL